MPVATRVRLGFFMSGAVWRSALPLPSLFLFSFATLPLEAFAQLSLALSSFLFGFQPIGVVPIGHLAFS